MHKDIKMEKKQEKTLLAAGSFFICRLRFGL